MMRNQKKNLVLWVLLLGVLFFVVPQVGLAANDGTGMLPSILDGIKSAVGWILYTVVFIPLTWFVTAAVALFSLAINADFLSGPTGLLNRPEIYELWKFIRDFCNIFFIFMLLIRAFSMIFQLDQYSGKKTLFKIILVALFVNFSFPVARVMIDISNVPTYFFAQQILQQNGGNSIGEVTSNSFLSASRMEVLLLGEDKRHDQISRLFVAIIFMFLFAVALGILAVLFMVRVVALVVLVIFSPIGFMRLMPGIGGSAGEWWKQLMGYLIFAPAAMLMLLVSVRFVSVLSSYNLEVNAVAGVYSDEPGLTELLKQMMVASIPIILIMMTITTALKARVIGTKQAGVLSNTLIGWGKRGAWLGSVARLPAMRGLAGGAKERMEKKSYLRMLTSKGREKFGKESEEKWQARASGGYPEYQRAKYIKAVSESEKGFEESRKSDTDLLKLVDEYRLNPKSHKAEEAEAAVRLLSKRDGFRSISDVNNAVAAIQAANADSPELAQAKVSDLIKKADKSLFQNMTDLTTALGHLGDDVKAAEQLIDKVDAGALKGGASEYKNLLDAGALKGNAKLQGRLSGRIKKEGHLKTLIDYDIAYGNGGAPMARQDAYDKHLSTLTPAELAKVKGIHGDQRTPPDRELYEFVQDQVASDTWTPQDHQDVYKNLSSAQKEGWRMAGLKP